ncbi:MAG: bifunctional demethylmenaquinone methyltransferase/2-methoxy-6-polyprenyl-1,4-benzoquinol methylase UbiE [Chloroflexi bacterium]|nr:bifunctional demethylmenaquinone methyltransferase/2-methoxy-6-polyprenyl-1,4-benzoquinol methylase UbiE [Chloroflexota bacterium]
MIDCAEKMVQSKPLYDMFTAVPKRYDLVNHVITWGLDKRWRRKAAEACLASKPQRVLDLCCGTGDLAITLAKLAGNNLEVAGLDYSQPMLYIAARKAKAFGGKLSFVHGDADNLPFPDGSFDCVGISFAFRNLTYKNPLAQRHIAEVLRVLGPGGRFVIVETSQPEIKLIRKLFQLYLRSFVFRVGSWLSGNRGAYCYLAESAARFYSWNELKKILIDAGFQKVTFRPFFFDAVGISVATKQEL